ncbi:MAG: phospholipid carrier-dependent glycosyltransferase, partial [Solirubrobacteraceae bacterium]|nr:phospholipid carrier-dependent glycosyltransferase [Solirubrobacteraceae bacterium]
MLFVGAQYANHDMLVGGLITAAIFAFVRAVDAPPRVDLRWLAGGWALCGLALLSKGLIGIALPALVIAPWLLAQGRWRQLVGLLHPLGVAAFLLVAAPWCVAMQLRYPGFFDYFIVEQHLRRYVQTEFNNVRGFWFFIVVLPASTLPWSLALPAAWRRLRRCGDPLDLLCVWWVIVVVGFFSLPSSKLVGYVIPALAPWCLLLARTIAGERDEARVMSRQRWMFGGAAVFCLAIVVGSLFVKTHSNRELAWVLRALMAPADRVVMVGEFAYDVPFYARLGSPVTIVDDWNDPALAQRDNWRKEMADAARFDPALGRQLLRLPSEMDRLACGRGATWFIVPSDRAAAIAALSGNPQRVYRQVGTEL